MQPIFLYRQKGLLPLRKGWPNVSSTVEIAHVFHPSVVPSYQEAARGEPLTGRRRATVDRLEEIKSEFHDSGIRAETALPEGHRPFAALLKIAKEHRADLVVAGTESKLGVERQILGSTAEELIRNAQVPVLTVGPNARLPKEGPLAFKSIIYATDFSKESARAAVYAPPSPRTVVHIFTSVTYSAFSQGSLRRQTI
ncbi:universal stress protein [Tunturiibacter gelidiferens]|uniref:universal stress protein n=1 Tax=Tunturiibacter gelidiferens TaxID=3069689 RepID=UPI003D9B67EA